MKRSLLFLMLCILPSVAIASDGIDYNHWISDKSENGTLILLEDGTVWVVTPTDQVKTSIWLVVDRIAIFKSPSTPAYPYLLVNEREEEQVHAKYLGHT